MKSSLPIRSVCAAAVLLGALSGPSMAGTTVVSLLVSNVVKQVCTGASQSTCTTSNVAGFTEVLSFNDTALSSDNAGTSGTNYASQATYAFPFTSTGNPYVTGLAAILTQAPTSTVAFTNLSAEYASGTGAAFMQIYSDQTYDDGLGATGDFQQNYNLSAALVSLAAYKDLTTTPASGFLSPLVGQLVGTYTAFGTSQVFNPTTLTSTNYAFTQYTADLSLVAAVPEPGTLGFFGLGLAAVALSVRRRTRSATV